MPVHDRLCLIMLDHVYLCSYIVVHARSLAHVVRARLCPFMGNHTCFCSFTLILVASLLREWSPCVLPFPVGERSSRVFSNHLSDGTVWNTRNTRTSWNSCEIHSVISNCVYCAGSILSCRCYTETRYGRTGLRSRRDTLQDRHAGLLLSRRRIWLARRWNPLCVRWWCVSWDHLKQRKWWVKVIF